MKRVSVRTVCVSEIKAERPQSSRNAPVDRYGPLSNAGMCERVLTCCARRVIGE